VSRLAVLVSGRGSNLQAIIDAGFDIAVVVSNRPGAAALERAGAARIPTACATLRAALDAGRTRRDYDADLAALLQRYEPDWVVLAGWMHVLSSAFLDAFPERVVNLHPALPGAFPGANAIEEAYAAAQRGEVDRTGVMVHLVPDEGVDSGPVLAQEEVAIRPDDSLDTLTERIHRVEHRLLVDTLRRVTAGDGAQ
jgi:phosphoribosylglycinamide formyltransferase 1